jgi:peptidoglycan/LPS O-acetylase OafA/YrhL
LFDRKKAAAKPDLDAMTNSRETYGIDYRPDIDGLRAVAIVPVVLYHAGIAPFEGGYVGVDVFFVVSGYLITAFILGQIDRDRFSLRNFYVRRIRRIFPALFVMMAFCAVIGWQLLTPQDYRLLGESILATALFSSNILFWLTSGYFGVPLEQRPLLHTWSLGVEEQFYLVFPILLVVLCRFFRPKLIAITFGLCVLSFALNVLTVKDHPNFAFFLAPPRIWELFIGGLLAMGALGPPRNAKSSEIIGLICAGLIGIAIFGFSNDTMFPGFAALIPTIGAAGIIWAGTGRNGTVSRVLSYPFPVLIGKISYSLYLWHFPLLAFGTYVDVGGPSLVVKFILLVFSVVLSFASWVYIEQPVRRGYGVFGNVRVVFSAAAVALALFGGFGLASHFSDGFPGRIREPSRQIAASERDFNPDRRLCFTTANDITRLPLCKFGIEAAVPQFALWGDSHAESLRTGIDSAAKKARSAGIFLGGAGCIPELGIDRGGLGCSVLNDAIVAYLLSAPSIHTVILAGRWGLWAEGVPFKHGSGRRRVSLTQSGLPIDNHQALSIGLENAVARLTAAGKRVWLVGPIPEIGYEVPRTLYLYSLGFPERVDIRPTLKEFKEREVFVLRKFSEMIEKYNVRAVWPHQYLCDSDFCRVQKNRQPLYIDDHHLTRSAASSMAEIFDPIFADPALPDRTIVETR